MEVDLVEVYMAAVEQAEEVMAPVNREMVAVAAVHQVALTEVAEV